MEYIVLDVSDIELEVIPLHELPGLKALRVLSMPADMQRLKMSADLLRLALRNPEDWNGLVKFLSLRELMAVIDQWMEKSQDESNRQIEEDEYYNELRGEEEEHMRFVEDEEEYEQKEVDSSEMLEEFIRYFESSEFPEEPDEDE
jgi:hypothetical protein